MKRNVLDRSGRCRSDCPLHRVLRHERKRRMMDLGRKSATKLERPCERGGGRNAHVPYPNDRSEIIGRHDHRHTENHVPDVEQRAKFQRFRIFRHVRFIRFHEASREQGVAHLGESGLGMTVLRRHAQRTQHLPGLKLLTRLNERRNVYRQCLNRQLPSWHGCHLMNGGLVRRRRCRHRLGEIVRTIPRPSSGAFRGRTFRPGRHGGDSGTSCGISSPRVGRAERIR